MREIVGTCTVALDKIGQDRRVSWRVVTSGGVDCRRLSVDHMHMQAGSHRRIPNNTCLEATTRS